MCMVYATIVMAYRFVTIIMKVTAMMAIRMPIMMLGVSASPNTSVPTNIAVMGSKTPNTDGEGSGGYDGGEYGESYEVAPR